jgi:hypothetical protein
MAAFNHRFERLWWESYRPPFHSHAGATLDVHCRHHSGSRRLRTCFARARYLAVADYKDHGKVVQRRQPLCTEHAIAWARRYGLANPLQHDEQQHLQFCAPWK